MPGFSIVKRFDSYLYPRTLQHQSELKVLKEEVRLLWCTETQKKTKPYHRRFDEVAALLSQNGCGANNVLTWWPRSTVSVPNVLC
jgi:hypothetical protein